ncbi:glutamine-hydrolyzing GMP synthase [Treponema pectinovorum]|uniref:glutamine-hydrolyzing GMP synthase n=1 Tax=Treponema pectinovorum TaxID=164 RepID=UPI0011CA95BE|nr:glutamine-hydrolyzing GMP synthase [Treponema pectinovorum]
MNRSKIVVLDFGSQYAHLIAKRFRALGYYSEIALPNAAIEEFKDAKGIVLSGGPSSVYEENVPEFNKQIFDLDIPILGLCYGHQLMANSYGGKVGKAVTGEFGKATFELTDEGKSSPLLKGISDNSQVWMSHQDEVLEAGKGFSPIGFTKDCKFAALQNLQKKRFSLQFHCEVKDTLEGNKIFKNFADICNMQVNWDEEAVLSHILNTIKTDTKDKNVLLFLSGGVDSTVAFALLNKALGQDRVLGLHIDNGFMRKNESQNVEKAYRNHGFNNFIVEDASQSFLKAIENLTEPQKKRMAVGENFIKVRDEVVKKQNLNEDNWMLAQGTLYPDIIESGGTKNSHTIKTHHNRVEGIQKLIEKGMIIEPLKDLYKDEVRSIGKKLGLEDELVMRHPFPGPGLSINVLCSDGKLTEKDEEELSLAKEELDKIVINQFCANCTKELKRSVLPVKSVGVQGDFRTYRFPACLTFRDESESEGEGFFHIPKVRQKVEDCSSTITNNSKFLNRTVIKLYQKPGVKPEAMKLQQSYCTKERLDQLREVDDIVLSHLHKKNLYTTIFQHLTIDLPFASKKENASFVLRPVCSEDVMTARFAWLPIEDLKEIAKKISKLDFVESLYIDVTNKPPATFGWE